MERAVVDASVIVKFFVKEEYTEKALELRDRYVAGNIELLAPSLLPYEVLNAIMHNHAEKFDAEKLETIVNSLYEYDFGLVEMDKNTASKAVEISRTHDVTVYDAAYLALASSIESTLYTADGKLQEAAGMPFVKHIKDFR